MLNLRVRVARRLKNCLVIFLCISLFFFFFFFPSLLLSVWQRVLLHYDKRNKVYRASFICHLRNKVWRVLIGVDASKLQP
jgi:hypothetical protein